MEYILYIREKKQLYDTLLQYIDGEGDCNEEFESFLKYIESNHTLENKDDFEVLLRLIMTVNKHMHRTPDLIQKFEKIFKKISDNIKQTFSNFEIFKLIKKNKSMILYFIQNQLLKIDDEIYQNLLHYGTEINGNFFDFFYPEIKQFMSEKVREVYEKKMINQDQQYFTDFEDKRQIGENDSYFCSLIRQDSVEEFIMYVNKKSISISKAKIKESIFETNSFLLKNKEDISLIEYAAFYGSIQIFQYLQLNNVELRPSLWLYTIHGRNAEMIHLLEGSNVKPPENNFDLCLRESIKCHHNEMANYFKDCLIEKVSDKPFFESIFHYYNYSWFPSKEEDFNNDYFFFNMCRYNHHKLVNLYLKPREELLHEKIENNIVNMKTALMNKDIKLIYILLSKETSISFPNDINGKDLKLFVIPPTITSIQSDTFKKLYDLTLISIPSSVTSIESYAFRYNCRIKNISVPSSVTSIGCDALFDSQVSNSTFIVSSLQKLEYIPIHAKKAILVDGLENIPKKTFQCRNLINEIKIPFTLKLIKDSCFYGSKELKNVLFNEPCSITSIGRRAFYGCYGLKNISIPSSVTLIGREAFCGCVNLEKINIPSSIRVIEDYAFNGCTALTEITIYSAEVKIGLSPFSGCSSLKKIFVPQSMKNDKNIAFGTSACVLKII